MMSSAVDAWLRASIGDAAYEADEPLVPSAWECSKEDVPVFDGGYGVGAFKLTRAATSGA